MNFSYEFRRLTFKECPLNAGSFALVISNSEEGKNFHELVNDLLHTEKISERGLVNKLLNRDFVLHLSLNENVDGEVVGQIREGLSLLDVTSKKYRIDLSKNEMELAAANALRIWAHLEVKGPLAVVELLDDFDAVNLNVEESSTEEIENKIFNVVAFSQRTNPTTYIVSADVADKLEEEEFLKTSLGKILNTKLHHKSVFTFGKTKNNLVRSL